MRPYLTILLLAAAIAASPTAFGQDDDADVDTSATAATVPAAPAAPTSAPSKPGAPATPPAQAGAKPAAPGGKTASRTADTKPEKLPWDTFALDPKVRVDLDFRGASVDAVLLMMSKASGITIVKDPALTGGITVQSPHPQKLSDAFAILNAVLVLKSFTMVRQGNFLLIKAIPPPAAPGGAKPPAPQPSAPAPGAAPGAVEADAPVLKVYTIKYASATEIARVINESFGSQPLLPGQQPQQPNPNQPKPAYVKASAEDYSNTLLVNAPAKTQEQIVAIIAQIDVSTDTPFQPRVFKLQYALATDLEPVVQNILDSSASLGRGGSTSSTHKTQQPFYFFFQPQTNNNNTGSVESDERTNSLIVTASSTDLDHVATVLADLDKPTTFQSTTFVYPLKNARADVVANLLNESFGLKTNGPVGGSLTANGPNQTTAGGVNNPNNPTGNSEPASLNGGQRNQPNAYNNYNANGQQGGGDSSNYPKLGTDTVGLDGSGKVINIRNLMGQVMLVPIIDTNSVIVVALPQDRALVTQILDQMDQIPEQVMIETVVVEVNLDKMTNLGVEYSFLNGNPFGIKGGTQAGGESYGLQANTAQPQGLRYTLTAPQYQVFLQAIATDTKFNVLSTPRIFTTNNATAEINISQSLPYVTNTTVNAIGSTLYNYNFLDVGIVLTVTPRITSGGYVTMDVTQTANDFVGYTSFNAPIVNQREAQTTVSVQDGETVVLGGIINKTVSATVNKIPILGDLPLIGAAFRSSTKSNNKTELLVFMTPHIVKSPEDARNLRASVQNEIGKTAINMLPSDLTDPNVRVAPPTVTIPKPMVDPTGL